MKKKTLFLTLILIFTYSAVFAAGEIVQPFIYDMPIAICEEAAADEYGNYDCSVGRMLTDTTDVARWTNFGGCDGSAASSSTVAPLIDCDAGANSQPIDQGIDMATTNGISTSVFSQVHECFTANDPPRILNWTLPLIDCDGDKYPVASNTCGAVVGSVNVDIVWSVRQNDPDFSDAPSELWSADGEKLLWEYADNGTNGEARWASFISEDEGFNLKNDLEGNPALYGEKINTLYFKPSCEDDTPVIDCACDDDWKNHGQYVRCVSHATEALVEAGLITEEEKDDIVSDAAESDCGKKK